MTKTYPITTGFLNYGDKNVLRISLTGHRPKKLGGYNILTEEYQHLQRDLEEYIEIKLNQADVDIVVGHSGMALGADTIWTKAILAMREKHPGKVFFHAEIPMMEQPRQWFKESDINFWHDAVSQANESTIYGSLEGLDDAQAKKEAGRLLNIRNEGMLNHGHILLAIHDGSYNGSGTGNAVTYAQKIGMKMISVHPKTWFKARRSA